MNTARKLLEDLAVIGATIEPAGDRIILRAGNNKIPADLIIRVRQAKAELLDTLAACPVTQEWAAEEWQAFYDERAGILEFDGGLSRTIAEAQAFEACIIEWLTRNPAPSPAGHCAWCGERETKSVRVVPFGSEPGTHAWLHGECWRPWQKLRKARAAAVLAAMGIDVRVTTRALCASSQKKD
jgi:hypothetical protein